MNPSVFREYDIRGVADRDLGDEFTRALGRAYGTMIRRRPEPPVSGDRKRVAVGRDPRLTSPRLYDALTAGITAAGVDVLYIGVVPTPILYYAPFEWPLDGGIMITGSHNPPEDNGFKMLAGKAAIHGEDIQLLRKLIEAEDYESGTGSIEEVDGTTPYLAHAKRTLQMGERRFKIVVDAGNGAAGPAGVALYRDLGFDVVDLYCDMDGRFPNHHPDPTQPENIADLQARVAAEGAEVGIAFDGDGDRIGAIDGNGRVLWGDQLMILFGRAILQESPGATFIGEVKCSQALYDELERAGGNPIMWKVGHSLIKAKLKESGAALAGEMSGHIFFANRYLGFDDAVYSGARLLELLSRGDATLAALYDTLPHMVNTPEIRVPCPDDVKFAVVAGAVQRLRSRDDVVSVVDVDGVRANFGDGWGLVRASNTQPALVVRCEAATPERLEQIRGFVESEIEAARAAL